MNDPRFTEVLKTQARKVFHSLFDIREGEYRRVLLVQLNVFMVILAHQIVKPVATAQFLTHVGITQLPYAFVLVAIVAMVVSSVYAYQLKYVQLISIIRSTTGIAAGLLLLLGIGLLFPELGSWNHYALYVLVAIFGVVSTSQVWILAGLVFTSREAARLFGLIGAGAIAGGITGGYITSVLATTISSEVLLFIGAGIFMGTLPLSGRIWRESVVGLTHLQRRSRFSDFGDHPIKLIRNSRHLLFLASIVGIGVVVAKLVDYQFNALAAAATQSEDELAAFLGFWFSSFNVVSLVIQLFLTRRIVGMYGVGTSLFVLPITLVLAASLFVFLPILSLGIFIKAADITLKQSVNKSATELLVLPLPVRVKNQTKSFIDIFVDSAATGVGGLLLIFMIQGFGLPLRFVSVLIILLAGLWLYFAHGVRVEYMRSFRQKMVGSPGDEENANSLENAQSIVDGLQRVLREGTERQRLFVLQKDAQQPNPHLFEAIRHQLVHPSPAIRAAAIEALYFHPSPDISSEVDALIQDPAPEVRRGAVAYLVAHADRDRLLVIDRYLTHEDPTVGGAALEAVAAECRNNPEMMRHFKLERRLGDKLALMKLMEDPEERLLYHRVVIRSIGKANLPSFFDHIDAGLASDNPLVRDESILAAGATLNGRFVPQIGHFLTEKETRPVAMEALVGCGEGVFFILHQALQEQTLWVDAIRFLPKVCEAMPLQASVDFLVGLLEHHDLTVQLEALRSLNTLMQHHAELSVPRKKAIQLIHQECSLYQQTIAAIVVESDQQEEERSVSPELVEARKGLIALLERRLDVILERIFRLLGLQYPPEDMLSIYQGLLSTAPDHRANALEYLDSLLNGKLRKVLLPIAETALLDTLTEVSISDLHLDVPDQRQCLARLMDSRDVKVKLSVLHLIGKLGDPSYRSMVEPWLENTHPRIREYAQAALREMGEPVSHRAS